MDCLRRIRLRYFAIAIGLCFGIFLLGLYHLGAVFAQDLNASVHYPGSNRPDLVSDDKNSLPSFSSDDPFQFINSEFSKLLGPNYPFSGSTCSMIPRDLDLSSRYAPLQESKRRILLAANFRNNENVLPSIIDQALKLILFLGPRQVEVSIFENASSDKTRPLLLVFKKALEMIQSTPHFNLSDAKSNYEHMNRIQVLAQFRNLALQPLFSNTTSFQEVIFINDGNLFFTKATVWFCADDVQELLYQHQMQKSDITCGIDYWKPKLAYYDTW